MAANGTVTSAGVPGVNSARVCVEPLCGGWSVSTQKLNVVAQRNALALGLSPNVSVDPGTTLSVRSAVQSSVVYGSPEWCAITCEPALSTVVPTGNAIE